MKPIATHHDLSKVDPSRNSPVPEYHLDIECPMCKPQKMDFAKSIRVGSPGSWRDEYTCICGVHIWVTIHG